MRFQGCFVLIADEFYKRKTNKKHANNYKNHRNKKFQEYRKPLKTLGFQGFRWRRRRDSNSRGIAP